MYRGEHYAAEYVLMQASTWSQHSRNRRIELDRVSPGIVAENVRNFAEALTDPQSFSSLPRTLLRDRSLVETWWGQIIGVQWQARFLRGLEGLRAQLEAGVALPSPALVGRCSTSRVSGAANFGRRRRRAGNHHENGTEHPG